MNQDKTGTNSFPKGGSQVADGQSITASDPESHWRPLRHGETVYVLKDIIQGPVVPQDVSPMMGKQGTKVISETKEGTVREPIAEVVERIIPEMHVARDIVNGPAAAQPMSSVTNEQVIAIISETTEKIIREQAPVVVARIISETTEKMVRDLAPEIVERVIREEIEKLKENN